ncbi:unnamed protein product [Nesidiocoris tenuis]|uniref:Uncharacterized protein n=1 Tax=Nesidiocoris tenuis TaxID=355587 RepID=A0A6H5HFP5_9HEMI|nr:unnamed protein product [Nesidiocoris tenuis]
MLSATSQCGALIIYNKLTQCTFDGGTRFRSEFYQMPSGCRQICKIQRLGFHVPNRSFAKFTRCRSWDWGRSSWSHGRPFSARPSPTTPCSTSTPRCGISSCRQTLELDPSFID